MPWFCKGINLLSDCQLYPSALKHTVAESGLRSTLKSHQFWDTRPKDIKVKQANSRRSSECACLSQSQRHIRSNRALPYSAFAGRNNDDVLDTPDARLLRRPAAPRKLGSWIRFSPWNSLRVSIGLGRSLGGEAEGASRGRTRGFSWRSAAERLRDLEQLGGALAGMQAA